MIGDFLHHPLYDYDKVKVNWLKAILPILIIIHHIANLGVPGTSIDTVPRLDSPIILTIGSWGNIVMWIFFAMSGYGLVISYLKTPAYIEGFLPRSFLKLFLPYLCALVLFVIYRWAEGVDQIALFRAKGFYTFVPTSWFIFVLSYFYVFFYLVFKYVRTDVITKVFVVCGLVILYCFVARHMGISPHRYSRCPGFMIGMFMALLSGAIRQNLNRGHILAMIGLLAISIKTGPYNIAPYFYTTIVFLIMYIMRPLKEFGIVKFLSSISLEMFIIQYIWIYIAVFDLHIVSSWGIVAVVITGDVITAYFLHLIIKKIGTSLKKSKRISSL